MSTNIHVLHAKVRNTNGSPQARRIRAEGFLPAVAYGKDLSAVAVAVDPKEVTRVLTSDHGKNSVVKLDVDGKSEILAMVKSFQIHPVSRKLEHVDFIEQLVQIGTGAGARSSSWTRAAAAATASRVTMVRSDCSGCSPSSPRAKAR